MNTQRNIIVVLLFLAYFTIRCYFASQTEYLNGDYSYFSLRQVEHISHNGKPILYDSLSYGGRPYAFMPLYFYILSPVYILFKSAMALKIANNFFASLLVIAIYLTGLEIFKSKRISAICAIVAASIPVYISETLNTINPISLLFPASFFLLYYFIRVEREKQELSYLLFATLTITLLSSSSFLILLGIVLFIALSLIEKINIARIRLEYLSFFLFFFMWANFIIFKPAFVEHGFSIIWNNIPKEIFNQYFQGINLGDALTSIGYLPFLFGIYTLYNYTFKKRNYKVSVFISLFLSTFILFWLRLIEAELGLMFLGASLVILFGQAVSDLFSIIKISKIANYANLIYAGIIIMLVLTQILPGILAMNAQLTKSPSKEYINGFTFLKSLPKEAVILSAPDEGQLISYYGERKNVADTEYLLAGDANNRISDIRNFYTQKFIIDALRILDKYDADYILISNVTKKEYGIENVTYLKLPCFNLIYDKGVKVYARIKANCEVKSI